MVGARQQSEQPVRARAVRRHALLAERATSTESYSFNDQNKNPRNIYGSRNRINELYIDYTKGPVFVRVGRQAISWGESDTIALLDVQNPFDLTLGAPGFFQDVDEARIPLWTLRTHGQAGRQLEVPLERLRRRVRGARNRSTRRCRSTRSPTECRPSIPSVPNPQGSLFIGPTRNQVVNQDTSLHTVVVDHLPENTWANTRWGARLQGLLFRDYTVQGWFFRTFNQQPVPLLSSVAAQSLAHLGADQPGRRPGLPHADLSRRERQPDSAPDQRRVDCGHEWPHAGRAHLRVEGAGRDLARIAGSSR